MQNLSGYDIRATTRADSPARRHAKNRCRYSHPSRKIFDDALGEHLSLIMTATRSFLCFLLLVSASAGAAAQANEIALTGGGDFVSNQNVNVKRSWGIEGSVAHRLLSAPLIGLYGEVPIAAAFSATAGTPGVATCVNTVPISPACRVFDYSSFFVTPGLKLRIGGPGLAPYATIGGGVGHFSASGSQGSSTTGVISYGGGVDITLLPIIGLRGEVRDYNSGYPAFGLAGSGRQHNLFVTGGVVLRF
jgi:hypothetical protein